MAPRNIGAVYVWALLFVIFLVWIPHLFLRYSTFATITNQNSISALAALAVIVPLAAGVYDLSVGAVMSLSAVIAAKTLGAGHVPAEVVVLLVVIVSIGIGAINAAIAVGLRINSFIATLATGSVIGAITLGLSNQGILALGTSFSRVATASWHHIQLPFLYALVLTLFLAWLLHRTVIGRRLYAVGFNPDAARLAGISAWRVQAGALVASALIAGIAGTVLAAQVQAADPSAGPNYLIPAFSAAFLGATQFKSGRFNPWGTGVAVFMLGTGSEGLLLAGAPQWAPQVFDGVALVVAVGLSTARARRD